MFECMNVENNKSKKKKLLTVNKKVKTYLDVFLHTGYDIRKTLFGYVYVYDKMYKTFLSVIIILLLLLNCIEVWQVLNTSWTKT